MTSLQEDIVRLVGTYSNSMTLWQCERWKGELREILARHANFSERPLEMEQLVSVPNNHDFNLFVSDAELSEDGKTLRIPISALIKNLMHRVARLRVTTSEILQKCSVNMEGELRAIFQSILNEHEITCAKLHPTFALRAAYARCVKLCGLVRVNPCQFMREAVVLNWDTSSGVGERPKDLSTNVRTFFDSLGCTAEFDRREMMYQTPTVGLNIGYLVGFRKGGESVCQRFKVYSGIQDVLEMLVQTGAIFVARPEWSHCTSFKGYFETVCDAEMVSLYVHTLPPFMSTRRESFGGALPVSIYVLALGEKISITWTGGNPVNVMEYHFPGSRKQIVQGEPHAQYRIRINPQGNSTPPGERLERPFTEKYFAKHLHYFVKRTPVSSTTLSDMTRINDGALAVASDTLSPVWLVDASPNSPEKKMRRTEEWVGRQEQRSEAASKCRQVAPSSISNLGAPVDLGIWGVSLPANTSSIFA